ncbi:MAG: alpha-amylase family glycosyl hydrolase, partial [Flavobacteriaceae bacterium]|nr:alpha-amylase family glycosyl hydrolase [Flavobacteriaceae bacterium]
MKRSILFLASLIATLFIQSCKNTKAPQDVTQNKPFVWENAHMYFLLTDRFNNGDTTNDINFNRTKETAVLRGFKGGDFEGITQKINEGYFNDLGVNALWFSPVVEQIHGATNEGTGNTYGFHGYWTKDWTAIEPNFGTENAFKKLVETAHENGIRIVMDVVLNHTGPVTEQDPVWPVDWVRTSPACTYDSYENTTACTLVKNLPDILTESDKEVSLPKFLMEKWEKEGRLEEELASL